MERSKAKTTAAELAVLKPFNIEYHNCQVRSKQRRVVVDQAVAKLQLLPSHLVQVRRPVICKCVSLLSSVCISRILMLKL